MPKTIMLALAVLAFDLSVVVVEAHPQSKPEGNAKEGGVEKSARDSVEIEISVLDRERGKPIPAMIRVSDEGGQPVQIPGLLDRCIGLPKDKRRLGWYVLPEASAVSLPKGKLTLEAVSGLEYTRESIQLDLVDGKAAKYKIELTRFWNAKEQGWISGNTHLHLKDLTKEEADRYLTEVSAVDGLRMVFVSYLERALVDRTYTTNEYSAEDLISLSTPVTTFSNGQEYRHNFEGGGEGYGHVLFLNQTEKILPSSLGPGISAQGDDGTFLRSGIESAREQGSTIIWCHNQFGFEDIPSWLSGLVHAQNIFDGGNKGSYEDTFYRYLNLGVRVPFSTGTDWFIYDHSRVYARMEGDEFSVEKWLAAVRAGKTFITNGPLLEFTVDGEFSGGTVPSSERAVIKFRVLSRKHPGDLELVVNGAVTQLTDTVFTEHHGWWEGKGTRTMKIADPCWIALRISPETDAVNEFQNQLFAHTSPVFVNTDYGEIFDPDTAIELIAEIKSDLAEIERQGVFKSSVAKEKIRGLYLDAKRALKQKLEK